MALLRTCLLSALVGVAVAATGCSGQDSASQAAASAAAAKAQAEAARLQSNITAYRELLRINNDAMAVQMGKSIIERAPDSAEAKEVQQTLPEIEKRYRAASEKARLAALWYYQVAPMAGGTQSTATIRNSTPDNGSPVNLVLRRHTQWGQNVFLFGSGKGFVCGKACTLDVVVDGKHERVKAFAPPTGEPALMISDDKAFLRMLEKAKEINIDVTLADGRKTETLGYEVGGFDKEKWRPLPKGK